MVKKAGTASDISVKFTRTTEDTMKRPTMIRAGAVAQAGIIRKSGAKNKAMANIMAVEKEVSPVLPPEATPDELSTNDVTVLTPSIEPTVVPKASANNAFFNCGKCPFLSIRLALCATPNSVPMVSNRFTKRKVKTMMSISTVKMFSQENLAKIGAGEGGRLKNPSSGSEASPKKNEQQVAMMIPISIAPCTFLM